MAQTSVAQFATDLKMPAGALLEQLQKAGVAKSTTEDLLSENDKTRLLDYLRRSHGAADGKTKITLTRKETTEIRAQDSHGKSRTVQVEVRKKRVLVKRDTPDAVAPEAVTLPVVEEKPVVAPVVPEPVVEAVVAPVVEIAPPPVVVEPTPAPVVEKTPEPVVEPTPAPAPVAVAAEPKPVEKAEDAAKPAEIGRAHV